jgi:hypothetical protein
MKEPKQKAEELVQLFTYLKHKKENQCSNPIYSLLQIQAKQCALICVEEIIEELESGLLINLVLQTVIKIRISYWQEVKKHLE